MTVRNLDAMFHPQSLALVCGGERGHTAVGRQVVRNIFHGGFEGPVMPVHPAQRAVSGVLAYPSIAELPLAPDLAVITAAKDQVAGAVEALGKRGCRAAIVLTPDLAGYGQAVLDAARPHMLRLLGPDSVGLLLPGLSLNASHAPITPLKGDLAFVSQSAAITTAMLDWATPRGVGFQQVVSLGGMLDVDAGDTLDYLAKEGSTRAILLYLEAVTDARKFMSAARSASRLKPVIVVKGGRDAAGARAAASHTGALAGSDAVFDAAFRRAGMLRVGGLDELFEAAETLATAQPVNGGRMAIVTNGGGLGVLATDALTRGGGELAALSQDTQDKLVAVLPQGCSAENPLDLGDRSPPEAYGDAVRALLDGRDADGVLVLHGPTGQGDPLGAAEAVVRALGGKRKPIFTAWLGEGAAREARPLFSKRRIPTYRTPESGVRGFLHLLRYKRNQEELIETPPSIPQDFTPDSESVRASLAAALEQGREWLPQEELAAVLSSYGLKPAELRFAKDAGAAVEAAEALGYPVAVKVVSPQLTHKSEVGGVELELEDAAAVAQAARRIQGRVARRRPDATLEGFTVQRMVRRAGAHELIIGASEDPNFGPVMLFGHGGTAVELLRDHALALPPLNMALARRMMEETRVYRLLQGGYGGSPPAALDAIAVALIGLSQLVADCPEVAEVEVNPLLADDKGVVALDARLRLRKPDRPSPRRRLAIRPYPRDLEQEVRTDGGRPVFLRAIRPEDEPGLQDFFQQLRSEDIRLRFFSPIKELSHPFAARLTQIDYDREMALVAVEPEERSRILGVVHITCDPDNERAEYAVIVRSDLKGKGLGSLLMEKIIDYARARGIGEIVGDVLTENRSMLALCRDLGFSQKPDTKDPQVMHVRLKLREES